MWGKVGAQRTQFPLFPLWITSTHCRVILKLILRSTQQGPKSATFLLFIVCLLLCWCDRWKKFPGRRSFFSLRIPRECGIPGFEELLRGLEDTKPSVPPTASLVLPTLGLLQSQVRERSLWLWHPPWWFSVGSECMAQAHGFWTACLGSNPGPATVAPSIWWSPQLPGLQHGTIFEASL